VLPLPHAGSFALTAHAARTVVGDPEDYYWFVGFVTSDAAETSVNLTGANATGSGSGDSLVQAVDPRSEALARNAGPVVKLVLNRLHANTPGLAGTVAGDASGQLTPTTTPPGHDLVSLVKASQARALAKHPALGVANSPLNRRFLTEYTKLRVARSTRLDQPDWPEKLADECAAAP
jgi:hypothetical protein